MGSFTGARGIEAPSATIRIRVTGAEAHLSVEGTYVSGTPTGFLSDTACGIHFLNREVFNTEIIWVEKDKLKVLPLNAGGGKTGYEILRPIHASAVHAVTGDPPIPWPPR